MDIHVFIDISLQLSMFYRYPFGYPWISMDIHVLTCYGSSIQGNLNFNQKINKSNQFEVHYEYPTPLSIRKQNERNLSVQI